MMMATCGGGAAARIFCRVVWMMMPLRFWMAHDTAGIMALMSDFLPPGKRLAWASDAWAAWSRKTERAVG